MKQKKMKGRSASSFFLCFSCSKFEVSKNCVLFRILELSLFFPHTTSFSFSATCRAMYCATSSSLTDQDARKKGVWEKKKKKKKKQKK